MAAFRMRGHLLLAEIEEKDEVYCPFIGRKVKSNKDQRKEEDEEDDSTAGKIGFR